MKITTIRNENNIVIYKVDYNNANRETKYVDINKFYLTNPNILYIVKSDTNGKLKQYVIRNYKKKDNSIRNIVFIAISLMFIALILPIILALLSGATFRIRS